MLVRFTIASRSDKSTQVGEAPNLHFADNFGCKDNQRKQTPKNVERLQDDGSSRDVVEKFEPDQPDSEYGEVQLMPPRSTVPITRECATTIMNMSLPNVVWINVSVRLYEQRIVREHDRTTGNKAHQGWNEPTTAENIGRPDVWGLLRYDVSY